MTFAVQLLGEPGDIEAVAPCFQGDGARIRKLGEIWVLESLAFNACKSEAEILPKAYDILSRVNRVWALYVNHVSLLSVGYILSLGPDGLPIKKLIHSTKEITIYSPKGIAELQTLIGSEPLGSVLVGRSYTDLRLKSALSLMGDRQLGWSQIYDIIEFFGGEKAISTKGWAKYMYISRLKRTANHYRHLGSFKSYPLPADPPTLNDARVSAKNLLKRWISTLT
jgi:hypothetical protein